MTRARQTLALARLASPRSHSWSGTVQPGFVREPAPPGYGTYRHSLQQAVAAHPSVLRRHPDSLPRNAPVHAPELDRRYLRPALDEINLGFAGRHHARHPVHRAIAALAPGDPLDVKVVATSTSAAPSESLATGSRPNVNVDPHERWELRSPSGRVVGRLGRRFQAPPGMQCVCAVVHAVVTWSRDASESRYQDSLKCDSWEVVVPELVFEPCA